jgi:hypothetical protein
VAEFPLLRAGLITTEIIALYPIDLCGSGRARGSQ